MIAQTYSFFFQKALSVLYKLSDKMFKSFSKESLVSKSSLAAWDLKISNRRRSTNPNQKFLGVQNHVTPFSVSPVSLERPVPSSTTLGASSVRRESILPGEDTELDTQLLRINVGGTVFNTTREILRRYPDTLLGCLSPSSMFFNRRKREYFFDRNPTIFSSVLDLYRTSELHLPKNYCGNAALRELEFWEVPAIWVAACCWNNIHDAVQDKRLHHDLNISRHTSERIQDVTWRRFLWCELYDVNNPTTVSRVWNRFMLLLILASLLLFFVDSEVETVPHDYFYTYLAKNASTRSNGFLPRRSMYGIWLADVILLGVLVSEFLLKTALCPSVLRFLRNPQNAIYGLSLLAGIAGHVAESILENPRFWTRVDGLDAAYIFLRGAHFVRMIRFFEHMGSNSSIHAMWIAIINCKSELLLLLGVFAVLAVFFGTLVYFCELFRNSSTVLSNGEKSQREAFTHGLFGSLYWAIITMTTVGYGDIVPQTSLGRVVGALCSISGVIVLAMPVAILTESFQQYNLRQKIRQEQRKRQEDFFRRDSILSARLDDRTSI